LQSMIRQTYWSYLVGVPWGWMEPR
jgi:hypothetical protein